MDCHSNLTKWPWYSNVRTNLVARAKDVEDGRRELNVSTGEIEVEEMIETIRDGSMPPWQYKPTHSGARLSGQEKKDLIRGLEATFVTGVADGEKGQGRQALPPWPHTEARGATSTVAPRSSVHRRPYLVCGRTTVCR